MVGVCTPQKIKGAFSFPPYSFSIVTFQPKFSAQDDQCLDGDMVNIGWCPIVEDEVNLKNKTKQNKQKLDKTNQIKSKQNNRHPPHTHTKTPQQTNRQKERLTNKQPSNNTKNERRPLSIQHLVKQLFHTETRVNMTDD